MTQRLQPWLAEDEASTWAGRALTWLARFRDPQTLIWRLIVGMIVLGILLRLADLSFPMRFTFDEDHFLVNARNYAEGLPDRNDHPPLGKWIILVGMKLFGDEGFGWRFFPCVFGICSIPLAYGVARTVFRSALAGGVAAALVAMDGFFIAYSRTALLDGMMTTLLLAVALVMLRARRFWHVALACLLLGLAASLKWSALTFGLPLLVMTLGLGYPSRRSVLALILVPAVCYAIFAAGLRMTGKPYGPRGVYARVEHLVRAHMGATKWEHRFCSKWYTWPLAKRPLLLRIDDYGERVRPMLTLGNPLVWWGGSLAVGVAFVGGLGSYGWSLLRRWRPVRNKPKAKPKSEPGSERGSGSEATPASQRAARPKSESKPDEETESDSSRDSGVEAASDGESKSDVSTDDRREAKAGASTKSAPASPTRPGFFETHRVGLLLLVLFYVSPILPWTTGVRDTFLYHYLPAYAFAVLLFSGMLAHLLERRRALGWPIWIAVLVVAVLYAPISSQIPMSRKEYDLRMLLDSWK